MPSALSLSYQRSRFTSDGVSIPPSAQYWASISTSTRRRILRCRTSLQRIVSVSPHVCGRTGSIICADDQYFDDDIDWDAVGIAVDKASAKYEDEEKLARPVPFEHKEDDESGGETDSTNDDLTQTDLDELTARLEDAAAAFKGTVTVDTRSY